ncbi:VWD domain-containing protein [Micromonospora lupini]|uniref:von Willebrand factor type D protein n=1 Tax=Micromonospora lupini str. Lupac 08 TaxID=1150864 RepID=I0KXU8_9ACTN|nr:VWD domain-containing protein [Micromonospora lupini]CCH16395.1 von Willebrand factor type D protein [Micromonospora lupini str. Lupac 08]
MRLMARLAAGAVVLLAVLVAGQGTAAADGGLGLGLRAERQSYRVGEPVRLDLTVTNSTDAACALATEATGTVQVTGVRRDGRDLAPVLGRSFYADGVAAVATAGLATVEPGATVTVPLTAVRVHDGDDAGDVVLRSVAATPDGGGLDTLWPIGAAGRYEVTAGYVTLPLGAAANSCAGVTAVRTATFVVDDGGSGVPRWAWLLGGAALVGLLLVVATVILRVRRRSPAGAAALLLVVVGGFVVTAAPPARANYTVDPNSGAPVAGVDFQAAVDGCLQGFAATGGDPAGILPRLKDPKSPRVRIIPTRGGSGAFETPESADGKGSSTVTWNPTSTDPYGDGVVRDPCAALYHELNHADDISRSAVPPGECGATGIKTAEVKATLAENRYRAAKGLPPRTEYDGKPLPKNLDECKKPAKKKPPAKGPTKLCEEGAACASTNGDPHLVTFDRVYYDFQAVGEFVLVAATGGDPLEVQVRQAPMAGTRTASVNSAVAFRVGGRRVSLALTTGETRVYVDGAAVAVPPDRIDLGGGGALVRRPSDTGPAGGYDLRWPDGSAAAVDQIGHYGYRLLVKLDGSRAGKVRGLLGDFDGDPSDDIAAASGPALPQPVPFEKLYPAYADGWRVTQERSLLPYEADQNTGTFTDRGFPERPMTTADLDPGRRAAAEELCRWAGVTAPAAFADCVFDVGVSGRPEFAVGGAATERVAPSPATPITATPVATAALTPGGDRLSFPARAGDAVFVDVVAPGMADRCSAYRLLDPAGREVSSGCNINGSGYVDRVDLTAAGDYAVEVTAAAGDTGRATVRVYVASDTAGTVESNGPAVSAVVAQPGAQARYRFTGRAGERVFVEVPASTLSDQCSPLRIEDADGHLLNTGCVVNGVGEVDGTVLPADGTYTVVVDPVDRTTGEVALRIFAGRDGSGTLTVDGPAVLAVVERPGAVLSYRFTGSAGTSVGLTASAATLPDQCGVLELRGPDGILLASGCVINGAGAVDATALPATGTYTVVVNPSGTATGQVSVTLHR